MKTQIRMIMFVFLSFYLLTAFAVTAEEGSASPATMQPEKKSNASAKSIADIAVKAGVKSCTDRIDQVTNFLTTGLKSGAVFFAPPSDADKRLISFSLGLEMPGGKVAYASETFAPNQANGCDSMYETVVYWEEGCADVAKRQFATFRNTGVIVNSIMMLDSGTSVKIFLMPAGSGCVAIKKEVLD
jgi:hypothetical protein